MTFQKINSGKYQSKKYYIFKSTYKSKDWWYLYSRSDYAIAQYDIYCGMFKTCKEAMAASEELDRLDKKAGKKNALRIGDVVRIRLPNNYMVTDKIDWMK